MLKNKTRAAQRALRRKKHYFSHEIKSVRLMTNRSFRRKGRLLLRISQEPCRPSGKEYKTGGWISW